MNRRLASPKTGDAKGFRLRLSNGEQTMDRRSFVSRASMAAMLAACRLSKGVAQANGISPVPDKPSITEQDGSWTLQNRLIAKHLWWDGKDLRGTVAQGGLAIPRQELSGEMFVYLARRAWPWPHSSAKLVAAHREDLAGMASLELVFSADQSTLEVTMRYVCRQNDPAIEEICIVRNTGKTPIESLRRFDSCFLTIPLKGTTGDAATPPVAHWIEGLHDDEKGTAEIYRTYRVSERGLATDETLDLVSGRWSSNEKLPAIVLQVGSQTYYAAFCWSGEWRMNAGNNGKYLRVQAGLSETTISLGPGETARSPASFYGVVNGNSADAWNAIHAHCRAALMPPVPDDFPWVTYNTWYNFGTNIEEAGLREEADRAAKLGIEVFYIDDGWFEGSEATGKWGMGAGNWVENRKKFPSGIAAFADHVHRKGMKFGLWVELERLDAKFADQPGLPARSWLATTQDQLLRWGFTDSDKETPAYQVCFGDPRARAWAIDSLTRMVRDYKVDWIKWDHNRYAVCEEWRHGHGSLDGDWAHTNGVWEVMDALRRQFPQLILENCAAGGHRFDFGMMQHTHVTWTSDQTSPAHVSRRHVYGASHPYPPQYLTSWYIPDSADPALDTLSPARTDTLFRSHMLGAFGVSAKLGTWPANTIASAGRSIALYKRLRRYLRGELAWLTPQAVLYTPEVSEATSWEATQMFLRASRESVIMVFRSASETESITLRPAFLNAGSTYELWDEDGHLSKRRASGKSLGQGGVTINLPERDSSAVIYLKEV